MKQNKSIKITAECYICKKQANAERLVLFSRYCSHCKKRETFYFCGDGCFDHFLEHARMVKE